MFPKKYRSLVIYYAKKNELDPLFVAALIFRETRFKKETVGSHSDYGLMQIRPSTIAELKRTGALQNEELTTGDLFEPTVNIAIGTAYLNYLEKRLASDNRQEKIEAWYRGSKEQVIAYMYNRGPTAVLKMLDECMVKYAFEEEIKKSAKSTYRYAQTISYYKQALDFFNEILPFQGSL